MKIVLRKSEDRELTLDEEGYGSDNNWYPNIINVLDDVTADNYEKTRTIAVLMDNVTPHKKEYHVYVADDTGTTIFIGHI